jgi:hypothetical protein
MAKSDLPITSEQVVGIIPMPPEMCSVFDHVIAITEINKDQDLAHEVRYNIQSLRCQVEALREWGSKWKHLAEGLHHKHEPAIMLQIEKARDRRISSGN